MRQATTQNNPRAPAGAKGFQIKLTRFCVVEKNPQPKNPAKFLQSPVSTLKINGNYFQSPFPFFKFARRTGELS
jgi:hypothetical protein